MEDTKGDKRDGWRKSEWEGRKEIKRRLTCWSRFRLGILPAPHFLPHFSHLLHPLPLLYLLPSSCPCLCLSLLEHPTSQVQWVKGMIRRRRVWEKVDEGRWGRKREEERVRGREGKRVREREGERGGREGKRKNKGDKRDEWSKWEWEEKKEIKRTRLKEGEGVELGRRRDGRRGREGGWVRGSRVRGKINKMSTTEFTTLTTQHSHVHTDLFFPLGSCSFQFQCSQSRHQHHPFRKELTTHTIYLQISSNFPLDLIRICVFVVMLCPACEVVVMM